MDKLSISLENQSLLIQTIETFNSVPFVSTLTNLIIIIAQKTLQFFGISWSSSHSSITNYILKKDLKTCALLAVPFLNIYIAYKQNFIQINSKALSDSNISDAPESTHIVLPKRRKKEKTLSLSQRTSIRFDQLKYAQDDFETTRARLLGYLYDATEEQIDLLNQGHMTLAKWLQTVPKAHSVLERDIEEQRLALETSHHLIFTRSTLEYIIHYGSIEGAPQENLYLSPETENLLNSVLDKLAELLFIAFNKPNKKLKFFDLKSSIHQTILEKWKELYNQSTTDK